MSFEEQISKHIFSRNGGYCVYYRSNLFRNASSFENWGMYKNGHHLVQKYARIFVRGHYLFPEVNSFTRAYLEENCEL